MELEVCVQIVCQVESIIEYDSWCDVRQARRRRSGIGTSGQGSGRRETILSPASQFRLYVPYVPPQEKTGTRISCTLTKRNIVESRIIF